MARAADIADDDSGPVGLQDRYGVVLLAVFVQAVLAALLPQSTIGQIAFLAVNGVTLIIVYQVSRAHRRAIRVLSILVVAAVVLAFVTLVARIDAAVAARYLYGVSALFIAASPFVVAKRLLRHERVTASTMMGALSLYLLVGQFFAVLFAIIALSTSDPFFAGGGTPRFVDFLYFSFVTLTTLGYGDLAPATEIARMVAVAEALIGQLYLVSVVALVVGNLGETTRRGTGGSGAED